MPQYTHIRTLVATLPNACFILNYRSTNNWLSSVRRWSYMSVDSMTDMYLANCPLREKTEEALGEWYEMHSALALRVLQEAGACFVELDIERPDAGQILEEGFPGTSARCWVPQNVNLVRPPTG
jgi:hypothetical protein